MTCSWQVEIDPFARLVLAKHWPDVRKHDDVRTFPPGDPDDWRVDLVAGGFPCQDISQAGIKQGLAGRRSRLWGQYARIIDVIRPRYILIENVAALVRLGLRTVLSDLASLGFDAEWFTLSAAEFGAPHLRRRLFIVAYPDSFGRETRQAQDLVVGESLLAQEKDQSQWEFHPWRDAGGTVWPSPGPGLHGMDDGPSTRMDRRRLRVIGNAVVPRVAEWIGRLILQHSETSWRP